MFHSIDQLIGWNEKAGGKEIYLYYILVLKFTKIFYFAYSGHVKAIFKLPHFNFFNGDFTSSAKLPP